MDSRNDNEEKEESSNSSNSQVDDKFDPDEDKRLVRRKSLDPKIIKSLESDLMKAMIGSDLPDYIDPLSSSKDGIDTGRVTQTQTQFTMEMFSVDNPTSFDPQMTPASVTANSPDTTNTQKKTPQQIGWCDGCCGNTALKIVPKRVGPVSAYSLKNNCSELLPPQHPDDKGLITLVLDLDETLVHSSFMAIPHADFNFVLGLDANRLGVYVCIRPGAEKFLTTLAGMYELVLFTASSQFYADNVVDRIDPERKIRYRLYRESCTDFTGCFVKDLSKLGRDLKRIIIVDNSSVAYLLQPYNAIGITSWYDDPADHELDEIQELLIANKDAECVYDFLVDS